MRQRLFHRPKAYIFCLLFQLYAAGATAQRPNILIIMADDLGYSDLGCFGSEIRTPNLDKLAKGGMRMTQFYNAARCCPSRAALLTGLYPHQAGMGDMTYNAVADLPAYQGYLARNSVTIAEALKPAGYHTYLSGKWHVGDSEANWPRRRGFDKCYSLIDGASDYFNPLAPYFADTSALKMVADNAVVKPGKDFYMTDAITDYALEYLKAHPKPDPFFMYVAYTAPHWPLHALPEDIARYRGRYRKGWDQVRKERYQRMQQMGIIDPKWPLSPRYAEKVPDWETLPDNEKDLWDQRMAVYAAMIDRMDQGIGRILDQLEAAGVTQNTLVLFLSDNGGCHEEVYNWPHVIHDRSGETGSSQSFDGYGYPWANVSNTPFQLFKHWTREGGIASPFIAWYPAKIKAGQITNQPAHIIDLMATCVDYGGATYPNAFNGQKIQPTEGVSLRPLLENKPWRGHQALYWAHEGNRAVRQGKWKLVSTHANSGKDAWTLYDLDADRTEMTDRSAQFPQVVQKLRALHEQWAKRIGVLPEATLEQLRNTRAKAKIKP
jgi:arylsulfatase